MGEQKIQFNSIRDIEAFVRITTALHGAVRISDGERILDGKAIMGIMSLGLRRPLTLTYEGDAEEFAAFLHSIGMYLV